MLEVVNKLILNNKTIATMESCTGGKIVDAITSVKGASSILKYSCVTYSNEFKIKMGVSSMLIDKYTVYSKEVACDMAYKISLYASSDYGIGITGNLTNIGDIVYICVYDKVKDEYHSFTFSSSDDNRKDNKDIICELITNKLIKIV